MVRCAFIGALDGVRRAARCCIRLGCAEVCGIREHLVCQPFMAKRASRQTLHIELRSTLKSQRRYHDDRFLFICLPSTKPTGDTPMLTINCGDSAQWCPDLHASGRIKCKQGYQNIGRPEKLASLRTRHCSCLDCAAKWLGEGATSNHHGSNNYATM